MERRTWFAELLRRKKATIKGLARAAGVSRSTVKVMVEASGLPNLRNTAKVAAALSVRPGYLAQGLIVQYQRRDAA